MAWSPSRLSVLDIKLLRDAMRLWPQFLAIALVLASGVATLILSVGAYRSLEETRSVYYDRYRFADIFAQVVRAPHGILPRVLEIPGVAAVEARVVKNALLDIAHVHEPATGVVISLPDKGESQLNRLHVRQGRLPEPGRTDEVTVNEAFAKAIGASIGNRFAAILNGRKRELTIVGLALSPEYIYAIGPGDLMPDNRRFAVMWMSETALAATFDLEGAFNAISIKLSPGASEAEVIRRLDALLERYGGAGAYARREQLSHAFLDAELQQLRALSRVIPPIFLFVTAFLINMTLTRLIALEREQIGLLKAVGYGQAAIAAHYLKLVAVIASAGIAIGYGLGTWFGQSLTRLYGKFFQFPFLVFERDPDIYLLAGAVSLTAAVLGAVKATRQALVLPPAVAMQPPAPARFKPLPGEASGAYAHVSQMTMMSLRSMMRWPVRSALTALGLALSGALLVVSLFAIDSVESMVEVTFFQSERQQATIAFAERKPIRAVEAVGQLPGVLETEPFRSVSAHIRHGHLSRRVSILGRPPETTLSRALDLEHRPVASAGDGPAHQPPALRRARHPPRRCRRHRGSRGSPGAAAGGGGRCHRVLFRPRRAHAPRRAQRIPRRRLRHQRRAHRLRHQFRAGPVSRRSSGRRPLPRSPCSRLR